MSLLRLPYEVRERVLRYALKQPGTLELQHTAWSGNSVFAQPLFQTCRCLRDEALQAFYEVNVFLWVLDIRTHSNPADYASMRPPAPWEDRYAAGVYSEHVLMENQQHGPSEPLSPSRPWEYPYLKKHLRFLNLHVYLPSNLGSTHSSSQAWLQGLPTALERLVEALEQGRRLLDLHIQFTSRRFNGEISLSGEQLQALEPLTQMRVKGRVQVSYPWVSKPAGESIEAMQLQRVMKAN